MGCDMYCVVEALNKKTNSWECFGVSIANRYYPLFSRIADVRNSEDENTYIEPIDDPRGWPWDVSGPASAWQNNHGLYHSATWLGRTELESLAKWAFEQKSEALWQLLGFDHLSHFFNLDKGWRKAAFTSYNDLRVLFFFTD